ncbi:hypothetical protein [[Haemophilus] ducreyi]|uniref:hypothetical protein n=1 Tax=Haemophilus ducreyi TaxID=730 RepID=UPI000654D5FF|nr:hypothetical protein [[Haemophilus] ducreyi]AKO45043.1 hypothetical protein RZ66_01800 [[Haemophilus] ducreyi]AKO46445.1 hypothetical protein RZ67_01775 [[Haemophilus] ducreyi]AKO47787.1 hypothetical protein RZ68_01775 [[Haemophilus] ducreyi]AKO49175.1 hypothetical protein RZ69_01810 [[Haemophilus] ducreyi]ANF61633.1 hypothetical protein A6037_02175 [[Haemophilus] ducreyi]
MKVELYEYIAVFEDDEPTKDKCLEIVADKREWTFFSYHISTSLEEIAQKILEARYNNWEMWDEDDYVYLIVRKYGDEEWELHKATIQYRLYVDTEEIYFDDEE